MNWYPFKELVISETTRVTVILIITIIIICRGPPITPHLFYYNESPNGVTHRTSISRHSPLTVTVGQHQYVVQNCM